MVTQPLPPQLVANALAVQEAYREYQQRALARERPAPHVHRHADAGAGAGGVRRGAAGGAARQPARAAAAGAGRRRAPGGRAATCSAKPVFASRDELGGLTRSFADMTAAAVRGARAGAAQRGAARRRARANLQTILDNLTAGVIVFDRQRHASTPSTRAPRASCALPLSAYRGRRSTEVPGLAEFAQDVWQRFELHAASPEAGERDHWQDAFELQRRRRRHERDAINTAGARRRDAARGAADGVRRHHRDRLGAARRRPGARWRAAWRTRSRTR